VQTSVVVYVALSAAGAVYVYSKGHVPRERSTAGRYRAQPPVTLEPPTDSEGIMRELPPPVSVTAEEKAFRQEVALSLAEPEEPSLVLESAACAAKDSAVCQSQ
jgi:hypothetical protein